MKVWLNVKEACDYLGVKKTSLYRYVNDYDLPCSVGCPRRFHIRDLDSWLMFRKPYKNLKSYQKDDLNYG